MRIYPLSALALILLAGCNESKAQNAPVIYQDFCASCHGNNGEGGSAPTLFDDDWSHGAELELIRKNIADGIPGAGMPGFSGGLSEAEIDALVAYVKSGKPSQSTDLNADGETPVLPILVPAVDQVESIEIQIQVDDYITGLDEPWGIHFTENSILITEKKGVLKRAVKTKQGAGWEVSKVSGIPVVNNARQGGLLDIATDPEFKSNGWVYITFSHALEGSSGPSMTKLIRGKIVNNQWVEEETLFQAHSEDYLDTGYHYGSRITFDDKGHLFFSIGDRGPKEQAQDRNRPNGKIHRINLDGSTPNDNPFLGERYPSTYSYGNRNPQGLIWHPRTGVLWETEHGPKGGDELNAITAGTNFGWPAISYGINYNGTVLTEHQSLPDMAQPISQWTPSIAVCGLDVYTGDLFPEWNGRLLAGSLAFESLRLIDVEGSSYKGEVEILKNKGRIRDVTNGPDGAIYVALPSKIVRLSPR